MNIFTALLLFWVVVYLLWKIFNLKKYNVEIQPFFLIWKTPKIKMVIGKAPKPILEFFRRISILGVIFGVVSGAAGLYFVVKGSIDMFTKGGEPSVLPVVPGVTVPFDLSVLLIISILAIVHELSHGLTSESLGIEVKDAGIIVILAVIMAFVEIDEEKLKEKSLMGKLKIFSMGSMGNYLAAILTFLIAVSLLSGFPSNPSGVYIPEVIEGGPASGILPSRIVIYSINGTNVRNAAEFTNYLKSCKPGDTVSIKTNMGSYLVKLGEHPSVEGQAYMGVYISLMNYYDPRIHLKPSTTVKLVYLVMFLILGNVGLGVFNFIPALPLDGGRMLKECLDMKLNGKLEKSLGKILIWGLTFLVWGLILLNFIMWLYLSHR